LVIVSNLLTDSFTSLSFRRKN